MLAARLSLAAAISSALALSACGGSTHGSPASSHQDTQLALAECMRAHGVSDFPDPTVGAGGGEGFHISATPGSQTLTVDGITLSGPTFTSAEKTCKLFGGGTAPPPISEKQKQQLVAFARCMRAHGISDWADPTFPPGGGVEQGGPASPAERNAPKVQQAAKTCNRLVGF